MKLIVELFDQFFLERVFFTCRPASQSKDSPSLDMKLPIIFSFLALSSLTAADWPHFLGPTRDGFSTETNLLKSFPKEGPELLWEAKLEEGFGGAAVMGDEVFIVDRVSKEKDILRCLSLKNGK